MAERASRPAAAARHLAPAVGMGGVPAHLEPEDGLARLRDSYDRVHSRLWRALLAWSGDREVADEAAAEAFAQAARRTDDIRDMDAWVWRSGFRIAAGELHRRSRRAQPAGLPTEVVTDHLAYQQGLAHLDVPEAGLDLLRALSQLTEQQRASVVLRDMAGLSAQETAAALNTTSTTVRVQALRARRKLRELLETDDD